MRLQDHGAVGEAKALRDFALHFAVKCAAVVGAVRTELRASQSQPGAVPAPADLAQGQSASTDDGQDVPAGKFQALLAGAAASTLDAAAARLCDSLQTALSAAAAAAEALVAGDAVTPQAATGVETRDHSTPKSASSMSVAATPTGGAGKEPPAIVITALPAPLLADMTDAPTGTSAAISALQSVLATVPFAAALCAYLRLCETSESHKGYILSGGLPSSGLHALAIEHAARSATLFGTGSTEARAVDLPDECDGVNTEPVRPPAATQHSQYTPAAWDGSFASLAASFTAGTWRLPRCGAVARHEYDDMCAVADASAAEAEAAAAAASAAPAKKGKPGAAQVAMERPAFAPPSACAVTFVLSVSATDAVASAGESAPTERYVDLLLGEPSTASSVRLWPEPRPPPAAPPAGDKGKAKNAAPSSAAAPIKKSGGGKDAPPAVDPATELLASLLLFLAEPATAYVTRVVPSADEGTVAGVASGSGVLQWCREGCELGTVDVHPPDAESGGTAPRTTPSPVSVPRDAGCAELAMLSRAGCALDATAPAASLQALAHGWSLDVPRLALLQACWKGATDSYAAAVCESLRGTAAAAGALQSARAADLRDLAAFLAVAGPANDLPATAAASKGSATRATAQIAPGTSSFGATLPTGVVASSTRALRCDSAASLARKAQSLRRVAAARGASLRDVMRGPQGELRTYVTEAGWTNDELLAVAVELAECTPEGLRADPGRAAALADRVADAAMELVDVLHGMHESAAAAVQGRPHMQAAAEQCLAACTAVYAALQAAQTKRAADCAALRAAFAGSVTGPASEYLSVLRTACASPATVLADPAPACAEKSPPAVVTAGPVTSSVVLTTPRGEDSPRNASRTSVTEEGEPSPPPVRPASRDAHSRSSYADCDSQAGRLAGTAEPTAVPPGSNDLELLRSCIAERNQASEAEATAALGTWRASAVAAVTGQSRRLQAALTAAGSPVPARPRDFFALASPLACALGAADADF